MNEDRDEEYQMLYIERNADRIVMSLKEKIKFLDNLRAKDIIVH